MTSRCVTSSRGEEKWPCVTSTHPPALLTSSTHPSPTPPHIAISCPAWSPILLTCPPILHTCPPVLLTCLHILITCPPVLLTCPPILLTCPPILLRLHCDCPALPHLPTFILLARLHTPHLSPTHPHLALPCPDLPCPALPPAHLYSVGTPATQLGRRLL